MVTSKISIASSCADSASNGIDIARRTIAAASDRGDA
jgi:hypothetical protein